MTDDLNDEMKAYIDQLVREVVSPMLEGQLAKVEHATLENGDFMREQWRRIETKDERADRVEAEVWAKFAADAPDPEPAACARWADRMLVEWKKRFSLRPL